jgi:hypothetical protein
MHVTRCEIPAVASPAKHQAHAETTPTAAIAITMTPTPPTYSPHHPSHSNLRLSRNRRPRNTNPYDPSQHATAPQQQMPVTPLVDEGVDQGELEAEDIDIDIDIDDDEEGAEDDGDVEFGDDAQDVEAEDEEEGDIEEGSSSPILQL